MGWLDLPTSLPYAADGAVSGRANEGFEFGEDLLSGIEVRTVRREPLIVRPFNLDWLSLRRECQG